MTSSHNTADLPSLCASLPGWTPPSAACTTTALTYHRASGRATYNTTIPRNPESELFERGEGMNMARPHTIAGGAKVIFPRAVGDGLLDLRTLRREIEEAETLAEDTKQTLSVRKLWRNYRDHLECALDARIDLLQRSVESHERAIAGRTTTMCRQYEACDPSCKELSCMAAQIRSARTASQNNPDAA